MSKRGTVAELARVELVPDGYSRSRGRNGWFTPRVMEAHVHYHADGTAMITLRQYSRRAPASDDAPAHWTMPLSIYREFSRQVNSTASKVLTNRRGRISADP
jgi:hypothetical protein